MARHPLAYSSENLAALGAAVLSHLLNKPILYVSGKADFQFELLHSAPMGYILTHIGVYHGSLAVNPFWVI
jgi:hypothetical protein